MSLPELFGSYLLHRRVASSESSELFVGQTIGQFPRLCVVKRMRAEISTLPDFESRFREDAGLLLRLIHGNVVQVLEVGAVEGQPFIAMEHIDGIDVAELVRDIPQRGPFAPEVALYVGIEICEAISYVSQRRREQSGNEGLKFDQAWPLKIMLSFDGVVKLISVGSARALQLEQHPATETVTDGPGFATPEVILREPLDARTDVFSVGLVIWELLAGEQLVASDPSRYVDRVREGSWCAPLVARKDIPGEIIRLLAQMLDLNPSKRPVTPEAVRMQLVTALRRIAPAFGSGQLARCLFGRYAERIGRAEKLTDSLMRRSVTDPSPADETLRGRTLTYGRDVELKRPTVPNTISLDPGSRIPGTRYRVIRRLGRGGSAEVFAAQHIDLDRQVAIKVLAAELAQQQDAISYFRLEARTCSRIGHPNIIEVVDFGELTDGRFFFAMELLHGASLGEVLTRERRLAAERAIPIFRQISKALQAAHEHGVIHRDLKPENVMLVRRAERDDFVKILDFGVMAFSSEEATDRVGTPGYMAPEQLRRARPTPATDVYALGATLYETLCGELPYDGKTIDDYHTQQNGGPPAALRSRRRGEDIHPALERVVHRALERDPSSRHPSAADFEADLVHAQREAGLATDWDDLPEPAGLRDTRTRQQSTPRAPITLDMRGTRPTRSAPAVAGAIVGLVILLAALFISRLWEATDKAHPARADSHRPPVAQEQPAGTRPRPPPSAPKRPAEPTSHPKTPHRSAEPARLSSRSIQHSPPPTNAHPRSVPRPPHEAPPARTATPTSQAATTVPRQPSVAELAELIAQGQQLLRQRHLAEAQEQFALARKRDPRLPEASIGLAAVAFQRARYDEAARHALHAIALNADLAAAHLLLGDAYAKLLRRDKALAAWQRALILDPNNAVATARLAHVRNH